MTGSAVVEGVSLTWAVRSDVGKVRAQNQDNVLAGPGLFVVADGMGGHADGAAAAASVVQALQPLQDELPLSQDELCRGVRAAVTAVTSLSSGGWAEPGSTLTALALGRGDDGAVGWLVANVGDSRTYRLADGRLEQLTTDHSQAQELLAARVIDADQARVDPRRNILTRAIGAGMGGARPDVFALDVTAARFLLCSDGLTNEVDDATLLDVLTTEDGPAAAAQRLLDLALAAGARDNVTVVVVDAAPAGHADAPNAPADPNDS